MKNLIILITFLNLISLQVMAQTESDTVAAEIFDSVEVQPVFPGGTGEMYKYLAENIRYPQDAQDQGIQGKVYAKFVVKKDGSIGDVEIVRGVHPLLDNETIRVIKAMPNWTPGIQRGKNVNVWYTLPINYKISGGNNKKKKKKNEKR